MHCYARARCDDCGREYFSAYSYTKVGNGAFWGIETEIAGYFASQLLPVSSKKIEELSSIRARLNKFSEQEQCELINLGYAVTDAALRVHQPALAGVIVPTDFPYPKFPLCA